MSLRSHLAPVLAILIALMFWAVPGTAQTPVPSLFVSTPAAAAAAPSQLSSEFDPIEKLRGRSVSYDPAALKNLVNTARGKTGLRYAAAPTVGLNLFEDTFVPLFVESVRPTDDRVGQVISGSVGYARDGHAVITVYEGAMAASVRLSSGEFYQVFVPTNGYGEVEQCRFRGYSHKGTDVLLPEQIEGNGDGIFRTPKDANLLQYAKAAGAQSVIDVMVAYTARAREARGGEAGMLAHINQVIAESNQGFANSNVAITFRLVHTVEVDFDDSQSTVSYGSTLLALRKNQDGSMDEVHALRDQYGADLVSLFISPPLPSSGSFTVGMAYILSGDPANPTNLAGVANFAPYAFSVVHQSYAGGSSLSFPHEAGHNLGLNHDTANGGAGGGFLKSSVGYQQKSLNPTFFTIMAYSSGCSGCVPLNNFSNPDVSYSGIPTGIAGDLNSESTVNAAATLELVRTAASNWRPTKAGTCSYSLSSTTTSQASSGGSVSVGVVAGSTCSWTAQSNASWITVASGASGSGNGTVSLSVASNASTSSRTGTVTIAGQTYTVQQAAAACTYALSSTAGSVGSSGGPLSSNVVTPSNCSWTAQSNASWITMASGASGSGNGTVSLSVASNASTNSRIGTVTIAGQTYTVQQSAAACTYALSSTAGSVGSSGGPLGANVVTSSNCSWTSQSNASWITVASGASSSGNGTVNLTVASNASTSSRTGTVTIAGQTYTVQQAAAACTYALSSTTGSVGSNGGPLGANVVTSSNCSWTAQSNASWITVASGASGSGNGTVNLSVASNASTSSRTGTVTIAGQTYTVQQSAAACTYALSSADGSVGSSGGPLGTNVVTPSNCSWTAQSNAPWITVTSGSSGFGNSTVSLSVASNASTSPRTGTVTIAGQTYTVQQAAAACTYTLSSTAGSVGSSGGPLSANVVTPSNCSWTAQSNASWITVASGASGSGNGPVSLSVASNTSTSPRTGTVTIAGQAYTVQQAAVPPVEVCAYAVSSTQFSFDQRSQSATVQVTTGSTCNWSASSNVSWASVSSSTTLTGDGIVEIRVQANESTTARTGIVTVAGQAVAITQSGQPVLPVVALTPGQIVLSAVEGSRTPISSSVLVSSSQQEVALAIGTELPAWLSVTTSSPVTPASLQIATDPAGLAPGTYSASIPIHATGASNPNISLNVTFNVEREIVIRSSPRSLSFSASSADSHALSQSVRVMVSGSSTPIRTFVQGAAWLSTSASLVAKNWVIKVNVDPRGLVPGIYDASVVVSCMATTCESAVIPVRLRVSNGMRAAGAEMAGSAVRIASGGIVNAASFLQGIAEGSWMSIFGSGFTSETREWSLADFDGAKFPTSLAGVSVRVNGRTAPIHFVSPEQINFQAPANIGTGWVLVELETPNGTDQAYVYASKENPGFFQIDASGQVAALLSDGRAVGRLPDNPEAGVKWWVAHPGDTIAIYGTGFGPTDPHVEPGFIFSGAAPLVAKGAIHVSIGGVEAKVEFAGQSGGGLNQINVVVPPLPRGDHEILAIVDGVPTQFVGKLAVD